MGENSKKIRCFCISEYQDKKYGKGIRVHNKKGSGKDSGKTTKVHIEYRCTVCGNVK